MQSVKSAECGKCVENFNFQCQFQFQFSISNADKQFVNNRKKRKREKRDESLHFKMRRAGMVICVVVFTNAPVLLSLSTTRQVFKENGSILNSYIHNIVEWLALRKVPRLLNHFKCNTLALWY